jgi:hypothetical protein
MPMHDETRRYSLLLKPYFELLTAFTHSLELKHIPLLFAAFFTRLIFFFCRSQTRLLESIQRNQLNN